MANELRQERGGGISSREFGVGIRVGVGVGTRVGVGVGGGGQVR